MLNFFGLAILGERAFLDMAASPLASMACLTVGAASPFTAGVPALE